MLALAVQVEVGRTLLAQIGAALLAVLRTVQARVAAGVVGRQTLHAGHPGVVLALPAPLEALLASERVRVEHEPVVAALALPGLVHRLTYS